MDIETLEGIARLMAEYSITKLDADFERNTCSFERGAAPGSTQVPTLPLPLGMVQPIPVPYAPTSADTPVFQQENTAGVQIPQQSLQEQSALDFSRTSEVTAPMVGVFYVAPAPGAEPFVRVGDHVSKGDTLCILEAMKMMNEVSADRDGEIVEICVADGELVEYGRVLFRIY